MNGCDGVIRCELNENLNENGDEITLDEHVQVYLFWTISYVFET